MSWLRLAIELDGLVAPPREGELLEELCGARDAIRDAIATLQGRTRRAEIEARCCVECGTPLPPHEGVGRPRVTCSDECRHEKKKRLNRNTLRLIKGWSPERIAEAEARLAGGAR